MFLPSTLMPMSSMSAFFMIISVHFYSEKDNETQICNPDGLLFFYNNELTDK